MWTKYKKFVFWIYGLPQVGQVGRGLGGEGVGNKTEGINSDPQGAENMKKEPKVLYFGCFLNCQIAVQIIPIGS
jgi:hypothetical protein